MIAAKLITEINSVDLLKFQISHYRERLADARSKENWPACAFIRRELFGFKQVLQSKLN